MVLPADPMGIELRVTHQRQWWRTDDDDENPERWYISADIGGADGGRDPARHVGDIAVAMVDLQRDRNLFDSLSDDEWGLEFIAETVLDLAKGRLLPAAEEQVAATADGPERMVILRHLHLAEPWRGQGLGGLLVAGALRTLARGARVAVCRVSPSDFAGDRLGAELASARMGGMLERIGFRRWHDVHLVGLQDPALLDARMTLFEHRLLHIPDPSAHRDGHRDPP